MTIAEAAALLGLAPSTVRAQVRAGRIRATRHGTSWYLTPGAVERYRVESLGRPGLRAGQPQPWRQKVDRRRRIAPPATENASRGTQAASRGTQTLHVGPTDEG